MKAGSPPLARGNLPEIRRSPTSRGFTPARAGKSNLDASFPFNEPVHPRSRGEIFGKAAGAAFRGGSPPLARGNPTAEEQRLIRDRFTPARAGKSPAADEDLESAWVHPRSRGEIPLLGEHEERCPGSPPLARGNLGYGDVTLFNLRFTPARAGKSYRGRRKGPRRRVHPRSRGEIRRYIDWRNEIDGSPPLARGNLTRADRRIVGWGFTPARAGKSGTPSELETLTMGSPPLARGNRRGRWLPILCGGFTPARAGKS